MKLLVASHLYPSPLSHTGGSFVQNQVRFLRAHCDIQVVVPTPWFPLPFFPRWSAHRQLPRREWVDGVEVLRPRYVTLPRRILFSRVWRSYLAAMEGSAEIGADLVHAHCAYPDGYAAVEYGRRHRVPVVITVHGHDIKVLPDANPRWKRLIARALDAASAVVAVSEDLASRVRDLGVSTGKIHTIPNGVDCDLFEPDLDRTPGADGWHVVYVGRFDPAKGIGILLEAFAGVLRKIPECRLTLVGGNEATGSEDRFRGQMEAFGLDHRVSWNREVEWDQVPVFLRRADLFVLPSYSEGLPLSLIESMACGLPIVATRCGGPEELVDDSVGRLVAVGDVEGLESAIIDVVCNYGEFDRSAIRSRAQQFYDYRNIARRLNELYTSVVRNEGLPSTVSSDL